MNRRFRPANQLLLLSLVLSLATPVLAHGVDEILPDTQALNQLVLRAQQASPREQCFLYAELVHDMTELAGHQMRDGNIDLASATLKQAQHYAQLIHLGLARDTKRLKNTQLLMHHTTYRLAEYLHQASSEDRPVLQATLKQLSLVEDELLTQVFNH
jgi:hypothetical protein